MVMYMDDEQTSRLIELTGKFKPDLANYGDVYKDIHRNPELSRQKSRKEA